MTEFRRLAIPDVLEIVPARFQDHRGYFSEVYKRTDFEAEGLGVDWIQDNQSGSAHAGTIRGLHYQVPPVAQAKLVRVVRGAIFDVAVDIRKGSPTYGDWVGCELTSEKANQMFVPIGFAHGFMTLLPDTEVLYKVSAPYSVEHERAILWNDPEIAIAWPAPSEEFVLSDKDRHAPRLADLDAPIDDAK